MTPSGLKEGVPRSLAWAASHCRDHSRHQVVPSERLSWSGTASPLTASPTDGAPRPKSQHHHSRRWGDVEA
jgi:hypothetical protein